jgi:hypothetical protein
MVENYTDIYKITITLIKINFSYFNRIKFTEQKILILCL